MSGWATIAPVMRAQSAIRWRGRDERQAAIFRAIFVNADDPDFRLSEVAERFARSDKVGIERMLAKAGCKFSSTGKFLAMPIDLKRRCR